MRWAVLALVLACHDRPVAPYPDLPDPPESDLAVGDGDSFDVRVFDEPELTNTYVVASDGTINFPLVGKVPVEGMTPSQIEVAITEKLADGFLVSPQVSVRILEYKSKKVTVIGQVRQPGTFAYSPAMSIVEAIARAGGFTPVAKKNAVKVTRKVDGKVEVFYVAVDDIGKGKSPDFILRPGDHILVDERAI